MKEGMQQNYINYKQFIKYDVVLTYGSANTSFLSTDEGMIVNANNNVLTLRTKNGKLLRLQIDEIYDMEIIPEQISLPAIC